MDAYATNRVDEDDEDTEPTRSGRWKAVVAGELMLVVGVVALGFVLVRLLGGAVGCAMSLGCSEPATFTGPELLAIVCGVGVLATAPYVTARLAGHGAPLMGAVAAAGAFAAAFLVIYVVGFVLQFPVFILALAPALAVGAAMTLPFPGPRALWWRSLAVLALFVVSVASPLVAVAIALPAIAAADELAEFGDG